jgi:hypothetical protein
MSFLLSNIKMYYSGASFLNAPQTDSSLSLGGYKSSSEVPNSSLNNLFPDVSGTDTFSGTTQYRAFFVINENYEIWQNPKTYVYQTTGGSYESVYFGLESSISGSIQTILNQNMSPTGIAWYNPTDLSGGISFSDVPSQEYFGVWIKKEVLPSSGTGTQIHSFTLAFSADIN